MLLLALRSSVALACGLVVFAQDYTLGADSERRAGVPRGSVEKRSWISRVYPGTTRDYWIYVPAQYSASKPACVMLFQDGGGYVNETGAWRVPVVFDNLIAAGDMPVTIGIFINPGVLPPADPDKQQPRFNRSYEYDALGDRYARFLLDEILPEVGKRYNLSRNPDDRAVAGSSSGGIAAFTAAWTRPEAFRRVLSFIGSYTDLRGGDIYPAWIRKTEPKPLRVFLQDGSNDLNLYAGDWWMANQTMYSALQFSGYEVEFARGTEGHNARHGGAILPDALRWLWKGYPQPVRASTERKTGERHFITEILDPAGGWELVGDGYEFTEGPAVDRNGNVFFVDVGRSRIYRTAASGKPAVWKEDAGEASGLMFGHSGALYAVEQGRKRVVSYSPSGGTAVIADGIEGNDLAVARNGGIYVTEPSTRRIWYFDPSGARRVADEGRMAFPNGVRLSPDQAQLYVADTATKWVWSFGVNSDGSLSNPEPFFRIEIPDDVSHGPLRSGADGMTVDADGYLYVATKIGVQICDPPGRVVAIISSPSDKDLSNLVFGGPDLQWLYATAGDKVFRRHLRRKGAFPWEPVKPPQPRL